MAPAKHEECEKCEEHMAWEERLKMLENIPELMTWKNQSKGGLYIIGILIPIIFAIVIATRAEIFTRLKEYEEFTSTKQEKIAEQVKSISENTHKIRTDVAVLVNTTELRQREIEKELLTLHQFHKGQ